MKRLLSILLIVVFAYTVNNLQAQPWNSLLPIDKVENGSLTFFDIQKAFNDYWIPKDVVEGYYYVDGVKTKAGGWKQFKRWEWYWETRVNPLTGAFPNTSAWEEYQKIKKLAGGQRSSSGQWTSMGPSSSPGGYAGLGRLNCIGFHPTDNDVMYVGAASGGIWKTTDGSSTWTPKGDDIDAIGVSDIIVVETAGDDLIYLATGDKDHSDTYSVGILKSTDGGINWSSTGLVFTAGQKKLINRLLIDPSNDDILYAATSSGLYKTTNAGVNWSIITSSIFIDLEFKPGVSGTIYGSTKYGDIYRSTDSGVNWTGTLNTSGYRTEIAVSTDNSAIVYAVIASSNNELFGVYKSTDSGASFSLAFSGTNLLGWNCDGGIGGQGWYDLCIAADPNDVDIVFLGGVNTWKSTDGGSSWSINNHWSSTCGGGATTVHADKHNLVFRNGSSTLFECNDGGLYNTSNGGSSWSHLTNGMVISQMYRLGVAQTTTDDVITGLQDNGTKALLTSTWYDVIGGDGMECLIDYSNEDTQYGSIYYGRIYRTTNHWASSTIISNGISGSAAWVTPYTQDPNNSNTLYVGYQDVWKSANQGGSWSKISNWGGYTLRSLTIAPSNSNTIYAATTSIIYGTSNGGTSWTNITGTLPVGSSTIKYISVKYDDPNTLWVAMGEFNNYGVFESTDGGSTWTDISTGLPTLPTNCVIQNRQNTSQLELYAATDVGVYLKLGGADWIPFYSNMPNVVVTELDIYYDDNTPANSMIRAATFGRGLWESDLYSATSIPLAANFNANTTSVIIGSEVIFTDASTGTPTSWEWSFAGGTPNSYTGQTPPPIQYNTEGNWDVTLIVSDGVDTDTSTMLDFINVTPCSYCTMSYSNTVDDYISRVVFNDIDNPSGSTSFSDFTAISTDAERGQIYTLSADVTVNGSWAQHCWAWFDWNDNCGFTDAEEAFDLGVTPGTAGTHTLTVSVTIPEDAVLGDTRMRIAEHYDSDPTSCQISTFGEGEDYTVNITETVPENLSVQNQTITDGQTECYNASSTITVAGSGTTVDINSGGEANFIAGQNVFLKPGFHSHAGSYTHAYITLTGDYCSSLPPLIAAPDSIDVATPFNPDLFTNEETTISIYPNPSTGIFTIDFMGTKTTAEIRLLNFHGKQLTEKRCKNQLRQEIDIGHLPGGMYVIIIKTQSELITKKIIKK